MSTQKIISLSELQQHNQSESAWIAIDNKVYDITKFAALHPGGKNVLLEQAGKDATKLFYYFHRSNILNKYHSKLYIGELESSAQKNKKELFNPPKNGLGEQIPYGDPNWYQGWNSPYYNETHRKLQKFMREFVANEIDPYVTEWEEAGKVPKDVQLKLAEQGILQVFGMGFPWDKEYMGNNLPGGIKPEEYDIFHVIVLIQEMSKCGSAGVPGAFGGGISIALPPVFHFGSDYLKQKVLKDCLNGSKNICLAITEPWGGSDVQQIQCSATLTPDNKYFIVNGTKKWITNGYYSDFFVTAVRTGGEGMKGISLILIEKDMPGVSTKKMKVMGSWASGTTYVTFENVKVPVENLIGEKNKGFLYIMSNFNWERYQMCIQGVAYARLAYEESFKYAFKRSTFGKKLVDHPVIRFKLANMARQIEVAQSWVENIAYNYQNMNFFERNRYLAGPISLLKAQCTQTLEYCCREAVQIFGGNGYTRSGQGEKVERLYRDMKALAIPGGSEEIMLDLGIRQAMKYYPPTAKL